MTKTNATWVAGGIAVLFGVAACSRAGSQLPMHDSPPPQPMPPPQVVHVDPKAPHASPPIPRNVPATVRDVLAGARQHWRKDAVVFKVEFKWFPESRPEYAWLQVDMHSPSTGDLRFVSVGAPYDGQVHDSHVNDRTDRYPALPDFKLDLPEALSLGRRLGQKGGLTLAELEMMGAKGTTPIAAWRISSREGSFFALALDAQTGRPLPWQRVYNPPGGSDAELAAAWAKLTRRSGNGGDDGRAACLAVGGVWIAEVPMCQGKYSVTDPTIPFL